VLQPAFLQGEVVLVGLVLSAEEVVAAWETEDEHIVVEQALQRQAAPERRHPGGGARSRQCSGVDLQTNRVDKDGTLYHRR
jgi:hypothetical protein